MIEAASLGVASPSRRTSARTSPGVEGRSSRVAASMIARSSPCSDRWCRRARSRRRSTISSGAFLIDRFIDGSVLAPNWINSYHILSMVATPRRKEERRTSWRLGSNSWRTAWPKPPPAALARLMTCHGCGKNWESPRFVDEAEAQAAGRQTMIGRRLTNPGRRARASSNSCGWRCRPPLGAGAAASVAARQAAAA